MNKICTTIEQSKTLIELGIDINTADMCWCSRKLQWEEIKETIIAYPILPIQEKSEVFKYTPAWSLTALMELMPPYLFEFERGIDLNIYRNLHGKGWHCSYMPNNIESMKKDKFRQITNGDNAVDAAFEMVCWLKENGKI